MLRNCALVLGGLALSACQSPGFGNLFNPDSDERKDEPVGLVPVIPARQEKVETTKFDDGKVRAELVGFGSVQEQQRRIDWCWAACAEMILRFDGVDTTQEEIAARVTGYDENGELMVTTASRYETYRALSPDAPKGDFPAIFDRIQGQLTEGAGDLAQRWMRGSDVEGEVGADVDEANAYRWMSRYFFPSKRLPLGELSQGDPAVVALTDVGDQGSSVGHLHVLVGATWSVDRVGATAGEALKGLKTLTGWSDKGDVVDSMLPDGFDLHEVILVDPLREDDIDTPEDEMRITLTGEELDERLMFVYTREDGYEILSAWTEIVGVEVK